MKGAYSVENEVSSQHKLMDSKHVLGYYNEHYEQK